MMTAEKIQALRVRLFDKGRIRIDEASAYLGVSDETIRRYLKNLAGEGGVQLVRGGAILIESGIPMSHGIRPVEERIRISEAEKEAIGARAASLVEDGNAIILDGGTTTLALARHLATRRHLTILTNNLMIAQVAAKYKASRLFVIGGKLAPDSMTLIGLKTAEELAQASVDWAFLGAAGISVSKGFTSADPFESEVKKAMIGVARRVAVVADHTKTTASGFSTFAEPEEVDVFVTSRQTDPELVDDFEKRGIEVLTA